MGLYEDAIAAFRSGATMFAVEHRNLAYVKLHDGHGDLARQLFIRAAREARALGYDALNHCCCSMPRWWPSRTEINAEQQSLQRLRGLRSPMLGRSRILTMRPRKNAWRPSSSGWGLGAQAAMRMGPTDC